MGGNDWTRRYLALLGFDMRDGAALPPADLDTLNRIARAHVLTVPFESITSVLRRRRSSTENVPPLDPEVILNAWIDRRAGGLCFEVTEMVSRLLSSLGYDAHPVLGEISFPGAHQAVCVTIDGTRFMVDAGNGAPFFVPIPLDAGDFEIHQVGLAYRFHQEADADVSVQDRWIDGEWKPFCRYTLAVPDPAAREAAYQRLHLLGHMWVVDNLVLVRCTEQDVWSLRDGTLNHFTADGKTTETIPPTAYPACAADLFTLPNLPIAEAARQLSAM